MRAAFSAALLELATHDPNVLLITGDHGYALFDEFRKRCPSQYINAGIAEQNMVGLAAGLARTGFRPFVYGLSAFVPVRVLEQIKLDVAHDDLPVVLLGDGAGFVYSHLGTSHQSTEDIACARAIPGITVLSPADRHEMLSAMHWAYQRASSVYLRMGKSDRGDVHAMPLDPSVSPSRPIRVRDGARGLALLATGSMVRTALDIAPMLQGASVWSVPSIKPIDEAVIGTIAAEHRAIVTLEEHSVYGGLGATVAEITAERHPTHVLRIGVRDRFSKHCGSYDYLLREHSLDAEAVKASVLAFEQSL